ncbi:MAG: hypothetical protein ABWK05_06120 [Pyrobaculum sp.]
MICSENLCLRIERVKFAAPSERIEIKSENAVAICIKPHLAADWRMLLQALFYAYHWRGPAKNRNISALVFLTRRGQIKEALEASAVGSTEAVCAALGPREELDRLEAPRGEPYYPQGGWSPWEITAFALELVT